MFENRIIKTKIWKERPVKEKAICIEGAIFSRISSYVARGVYCNIAGYDPKGILFEELLEKSFLEKTMPHQSKDMNRFKKRFIKILRELMDIDFIVLEDK